MRNIEIFLRHSMVSRGIIFIKKFDFELKYQDQMKINFIFLMATQFSMFITLIITSSTSYDPKSLKVK